MTRYRERLEAGEYAPPQEGQQQPDEQQERLASSADYQEMSKADLLALAQGRGISPANNAMTKDELIAALEAAD